MPASLIWLFSILGLPMFFLCNLGSPMYFLSKQLNSCKLQPLAMIFPYLLPRMKNLILSFVLNLVPNSFTSWLFLHWKRHWAADLSPGILHFCRQLSCLPTHPQALSSFCLKSPSLFIHYSYVSSSVLFHHTLLVAILSLNSYRPLGWVPSGSDKNFWLFILSFIP